MEKPIQDRALHLNRRAFLSKGALGLGTVALGSLLGMDFFREDKNGILSKDQSGVRGILKELHHPAKLKRVI